MLARLAAVVALLSLAVAPAARAAPAAEHLHMVDLTGDFARVWEATAQLPDSERPAAFKAQFAAILPGFYDHRRTSMTRERYDAFMLRGLKAYPDQRAGIAQVSGRFETMFRPALKTFEAQFGPMTGYPPIYLVDSLGEFDGGTRELGDGRSVLMFGADVIAKIHMDHDIQPFFHHELFHLYHHRFFPGCDASWCGLWAEGLATYAAKSLNPKATDAELLLTFPEPLREAVEKDRMGAVCAVTARLASTSDDDSAALFSSKRLSPSLPPRFGYYVGYLVAGEIGRTHTLKQMAQMKPPEARREVEAALRKLADCSAG